ncbi:MAG: restriction endonuclease subunit S [Candidatus Scalindua sp.]|nr:restriction endonuclease subunit S [Candidatus Scalindua sp.]
MRIKEAIKDKITGEWGDEDDVGLGVQVLRTTNFTNTGRISYEKVVKRKISNSLIEKKKLLPGDIIIEKSGGSPNQPVGRVVFFDNNNELFLCNNFTAILRPSERLVPKYFFYDLFYKHLSQVTLKYQNKTTGIINLQLDRYLDEKINVPSFDKQKQIVQTLDTADTLLQKRREQLNLLDDYLKSVFFEMFGDPVLNDKKWETTYLDSVIDSIDSGWSPVCLNTQRRSDEIPVILKLGAVTYCYFNPKNHKVIPANIKIEKRVEVKKHELLFTRKNTKELVAASAFIFDCERNLLLPDTIFRLNYKKELVNGIYLWKLFVEEGFRRVIQNLASGSAGSMPNISKEKLRKLLIPIPPLQLQNKFASIVEQVEQTKQKMSASLDEMNNHFNALMQRYFG